MRTRIAMARLGVVTLLGAPFLVPLFSPWSRINCRQQEIDLRSGLQRNTFFLYWIPIHRRIRDTGLSLELPPAEQKPGQHHWVPVNTFGPYVRNSPHYAYHSALHQVELLAMIWDDLHLDPTQRRETAGKLLHQWQTTGSDSSADGYLSKLTEPAD